MIRVLFESGMMLTPEKPRWNNDVTHYDVTIFPCFLDKTEWSSSRDISRDLRRAGIPEKCFSFFLSFLSAQTNLIKLRNMSAKSPSDSPADSPSGSDSSDEEELTIISSPPSKRFAFFSSSFSKTSDGGIIQDIEREELIKKENMTRCERKENERRMRKKKKKTEQQR